MRLLMNMGVGQAALVALCGLLLGVRSQLYYLGTEEWQAPLPRLGVAAVGGAVLLLSIWALLGGVLAKALGTSRRAAGRATAFSLALTAAAAWPLWPTLDSLGAHYLLAAVFLAAMVLGWPLARIDTGAEAHAERLAPWLLALTMIVGLALRLSGASHGLPDLIAHCDTPKQLELIPQFLGGHLIPPTSYPLGHIYFYTAILKALLAILPFQVPVPMLGPDSIGEFGHLIIAMRVMQALMGAGLIWLSYLVGKRLWDVWTGLLAGLLVALDPVHLTYSWQMMGEVPQTFWVMASLLCAARILQGGGLGAYLVAGLTAGLAVATKMYGGYIILATLAGHFLGSRREHAWLAAALAALLIGIALGTPHLWLDPAGWWGNFRAESAMQYGLGRGSSRWAGLVYFVEALTHRFSWAWLLGGLLGLVFLASRRSRADLLFLAPAACALGLILVFRLHYLREWDLVNLTPFLSLALAAGARAMWRWRQGQRPARLVQGLVLAAILGHLGLGAASDAWVARQPDTRQHARAWIGHFMPQGGSLLADPTFSTNFSMWPDKLPGVPWVFTRDLAAVLASDKVDEPIKALAIERVWWQPPLDEKRLQPVQIIKLRNSYWENPEIRIYFKDVPTHEPRLLLPHTRVMPPETAFLHTNWARRQVLDLMWEPDRQSRLVHAPAPLGKMGYLALGAGKASLYFGPDLAMPVVAKPGPPTVGHIDPVRAMAPWNPPTYKLSLDHPQRVKALWVGLYPRLEAMAPLLARHQLWAEVEKAVTGDARQGEPAAEAMLWLAAARAAQGDQAAAARALAALRAKHPGFLAEFARLGQGDDAAIMDDVARLATATPSMVLAEQVCWSPSGACRPPEGPEQRLRPQIVADAKRFHLWLPQAFLPGFLKLRMRLGHQPGKPALAQPVKIIVQAHYPDYHSDTLARLDLPAGAEPAIEAAVEVDRGPVRLEVVVETSQDAWPALEEVRVAPDLAAEFRWRLGVIKGLLPDMANQG